MELVAPQFLVKKINSSGGMNVFDMGSTICFLIASMCLFLRRAEEDLGKKLRFTIRVACN
jgi:hypothetical protein